MQPSSHRDHAGFRKWCLEAKSWSQAEFKQSSRRVQAGFSGFRFHSWLVATRLVLVESQGSAEMEKITLAGLNWKSVSPVSLSHVTDKNTKHDNKIARYDFRSDSLLISAAKAFQARTLRADQCWGRSDLSTTEGKFQVKPSLIRLHPVALEICHPKQSWPERSMRHASMGKMHGLLEAAAVKMTSPTLPCQFVRNEKIVLSTHLENAVCESGITL